MSSVTLREGAENTSYYKFLQDIEPIAPEIKEMIYNSKGTKEDALEPGERALLQTGKCYPLQAGHYRLQKGGLLVATNVKVPNITGEMIAWWASWHSLDPLRYALWDPEDHYDAKVSEFGKQRALDPNIPVVEKLWGSTHDVLESFDRDEPQHLTMNFLNPKEAGYDIKLFGTKQCEYLLCANATLGGKIPIFMTENFTSLSGEMEVHLRFWIGYQLDNGTVKCKIPRFFKVPEKIAQMLMVHNYKEYAHLNKILPQIYAQEKDNWEVIAFKI